MISYKEDNTLKAATVTTITGVVEYQKNCRKYKDNWYVINEDCAFIKGRWYHNGDKNIYWDSFKKTWAASTLNLAKGIVGFDKDNEPVLGYYTPCPYYNAVVSTKLGYFGCMDYRQLNHNDFVENKATGVFFEIDILSLKELNLILSKTSNVSYKNKGYNIEDNPKDFSLKTQSYNSFDLRFTKQTKRYARFLGNITWGSELEFSQGGLPEYLEHQLGIVMCRDGSTSSGGEAVTVPYQGAKGLETMRNLGLVASERLKTDLSCSFHIHIGTLNLSRDFLVSLYKLGEKIQDELFQMFPYYKTDPSGFKDKNYNKKLKPLFKAYRKNELFDNYDSYLNHSYKMIFKFFSDGPMPSCEYNRKLKQHPIKEKWNRTGRYSWLNLCNALFSVRQTIEFRLSNGTLNHQKMINWLFICNAIVKYAEKNQRKILIEDSAVSLNDVLSYYADSFPSSYTAIELSDYLKAYVTSRKSEMKKDYSNKDYTGKRDLLEDADYLFEYNGTVDLF